MTNDHIHASVTDGYETIRREGVTPEQLFDLGHDLLARLDSLERVYASAALLLLEHLEVIDRPRDPRLYEAAVDQIDQWLERYRQSEQKAMQDRAFMDAHE